MISATHIEDSSSAAAVALGDVERALARVVDPCSIATGIPIGLPDMGLVKGIDIDGARVTVTLRLTSPACFQVGLIIQGAEQAVAELPGVAEARCLIDYEQDWVPDMMAQSARDNLRRVRPLRTRTSPGPDRHPSA